METAVVIAMIAASGAALSALFTFVASRRTSDDSRAIGLINAGQTALEAALVRTTAEVEALRKQLEQVRTELRGALDLHTECERLRVADSRELVELRRLVRGIKDER